MADRVGEKGRKTQWMKLFTAGLVRRWGGGERNMWDRRRAMRRSSRKFVVEDFERKKKGGGPRKGEPEKDLIVVNWKETSHWGIQVEGKRGGKRTPTPQRKKELL